MTVSLIRVRSLTWATVRPARWRASAKAAPIDTLPLHSSARPAYRPRGQEAGRSRPHHFTRSSRPIACLVLFPASRPASGPPDAHGARSRRCAAIQRSTVARIWHDTVRARGRPSGRRPAASSAPRRAWLLTRCANAPAGALDCATAQPCAAAAQYPGPAPDDTIGTTRRACRQRTHGRSPGSGPPPGRPAPLDYLQMRQQSRAEMALQDGRVVTRWQKSLDP